MIMIIELKLLGLRTTIYTQSVKRGEKVRDGTELQITMLKVLARIDLLPGISCV